MSANCAPGQLQALTGFGYNIGLAFQIIDDILDVTQTSEQLGKTAGKDTAAKKATYPSIVGMEKSQKNSRTTDPTGPSGPCKSSVEKPRRWKPWRNFY